MSMIPNVDTMVPNGGPSSAAGRTILKSTTSYYVSTSTGNDTGDGSIGSPWQTLQHATDFFRGSLDFNGQDVYLIMQTADTYVGFQNGGGYFGGGQLFIIGGTKSPSSYVVIDSGIVAGHILGFIYNSSTNVWIDNCTFRPITQNVDCVRVAAIGGSLGVGIAANFTNPTLLGRSVIVDFSAGVVRPNGFFAANGGQIQVGGNNTIIVGANPCFVFYASVGQEDGTSGYGFLNTFANWTLSGGNLSLVRTWLLVDHFSMALPADTVAGGSVIGKRFQGEYSGIINTFGSGRNYLPGTIAGTLAEGAQYI